MSGTLGARRRSGRTGKTTLRTQMSWLVAYFNLNSSFLEVGKLTNKDDLRVITTPPPVSVLPHVTPFLPRST